MSFEKWWDDVVSDWLPLRSADPLWVRLAKEGVWGQSSIEPLDVGTIMILHNREGEGFMLAKCGVPQQREWDHVQARWSLVRRATKYKCCVSSPALLNMPNPEGTIRKYLCLSTFDGLVKTAQIFVLFTLGFLPRWSGKGLQLEGQIMFTWDTRSKADLVLYPSPGTEATHPVVIRHSVKRRNSEDKIQWVEKVVTRPLLWVAFTWQKQQCQQSSTQHWDKPYVRGICVVVLALLAMEVMRCYPFIASAHQGEKQNK